MEKNTKAISKIISELSSKDYKAQWNKLTDKQKYNVHVGKRQFSYCLSPETLEAVETANKYRNNEISEEEYKTWCLHYNLRTA